MKIYHMYVVKMSGPGEYSQSIGTETNWGRAVTKCKDEAINPDSQWWSIDEVEVGDPEPIKQKSARTVMERELYDALEGIFYHISPMASKCERVERVEFLDSSCLEIRDIALEIITKYREDVDNKPMRSIEMNKEKLKAFRRVYSVAKEIQCRRAGPWGNIDEALGIVSDCLQPLIMGEPENTAPKSNKYRFENKNRTYDDDEYKNKDIKGEKLSREKKIFVNETEYKYCDSILRNDIESWLMEQKMEYVAKGFGHRWGNFWNPGGHTKIEEDSWTITFESKEEAMAFKLKWL